MKEIFSKIKNIVKKYKIYFIMGLVLIVIVVLSVILGFALKSKVEYKDVVTYEEFEKTDVTEYNDNITETHFELKEEKSEIVVSYEEIEGFDQVNVIINYNDKDIFKFESTSPIANVIKYNELYLVFTQEANNERESVIVINNSGDKVMEIVASDERDIITFEDGRIINTKYVFTESYEEVDENTGEECGKRETYRLMDNDIFLENYEYIYCLIDK